jgi:hypothetical protein
MSFTLIERARPPLERGQEAAGSARDTVKSRATGLKKTIEPSRSRFGVESAIAWEKAGRALDAARYETRLAVERARRSRSEPHTRKAPIVAAGLAGIAGAFFLDPESGRRRRAIAKDRIAAFFRRRAIEAEKRARYAAGAVKGAVHEAAPSGGDGVGELNDPALEEKVESEIFRAADAPKGQVSVNVEEGVVYLRGELDSEDQIEALVEAAGDVEGVRGVESLLHLPGEEAPSKREGRTKAKTR